jgi:hypothetical protein
MLAQASANFRGYFLRRRRAADIRRFDAVGRNLLDYV